MRHNEEVAERLEEHGHEDFTSCVAWTCEHDLERPMETVHAGSPSYGIWRRDAPPPAA